MGNNNSPEIRNNLNDSNNKTYLYKLNAVLSDNLDFHDQNGRYASHNFHSFPAKFPPQLPRIFIERLTKPGDVVMDPMMGSGTAILEASLCGRQGIGFDIDPLALLISKVKSTSFDKDNLALKGASIIEWAKFDIRERLNELESKIKNNLHDNTRKFIDYWFEPKVQIELIALKTNIDRIKDQEIRAFFELAFSSTIITKSGGVSNALDLGHTRPHRAKVLVINDGKKEMANNLDKISPDRLKILTKILRSPFDEFEKRLKQNLEGVLERGTDAISPYISYGNAQSLPLNDNSVDLVVTSPPYASNAIDYMRAHKFTLVWMGYPIDDLGKKRKKYIGGEALSGVEFEKLPRWTNGLVNKLSGRDKKKGSVLHRYYSEMTRTLREMFRVIKPGKAAIVIVGSSIMRGMDIETGNCLADIGRNIGFEIPKIGIRNIDRNKRMLPAGTKLDLKSQIQQRMHQEHVIGFYKPES